MFSYNIYDNFDEFLSFVCQIHIYIFFFRFLCFYFFLTNVYLFVRFIFGVFLFFVFVFGVFLGVFFYISERCGLLSCNFA